VTFSYTIDATVHTITRVRIAIMGKKTIRDLGEFGAIDRIKKLLPTADNVVEGIGDDCAVVRVGAQLLLLSCDASIEGVHFDQAYMPPKEIGWKAATAALSDIAAMGGTAKFALVTLAAPSTTEETLIEALFQGIAEAATACGAVVVGGDMTSNPSGIILDISVIGEPTKDGRYLTRSGAQPGDLLAVTGHPGESAAGLHAFQRNNEAPALQAAHCIPTARIAEGQYFASHTDVHAMLDSSDGLLQDAAHIAKASDLGLNIDSAKLPISSTLQEYARAQDVTPESYALNGGEDYELIIALAPQDAEKRIAEFNKTFDIRLNIVGTFTDAHTKVLVDGAPTKTQGYQHFQTPD
jgi:thiamine-monophosphate kinase